MSEYKITREYIQSWLYTYQSGEKIFETYYRERGKLIQMKDLYDNEKEDLSMPIKDSKVYIYTDLKCMNANFKICGNHENFTKKIIFRRFGMYHCIGIRDFIRNIFMTTVSLRYAMYYPESACIRLNLKKKQKNIV